MEKENGAAQAEGSMQPMQPCASDAVQEAGKGTAVLVSGILSIIFPGIVGLVLGCIALVKGKKVLAKNPQAGFARGGRICGVVGIVVSIVAIAALAVVCVLLTAGTGDPRTTVERNMAALQKADGAVAAQISSYIDGELSTYGVTGTGSGSELVSWLQDGMSYTVGQAQTSGDTAVVHVDTKSHDFEQVSDAFTAASQEIAAGEEIKDVKSLEEAYHLIAEKAIEKAKATTELKEKSMDVVVEKNGNGVWELPSSSQADLLYEIYGVH